MALTLQSALAGGRYPILHGHGYRELDFAPLAAAAASSADQEAPMDLSRRRSPSPDVRISTGRNALLDRAMGPPPQPQPLDEAPHDLRTTPPAPHHHRPASHSIIPFHKLRKHAQKGGPRARLHKRQRLEEAVSLLRHREEAGGDERPLSEHGDETAGRREEEEEADPPALPPPPPQLMQQMLLMQQQQQTDSVAYPSLLYLQYCAMVQSLQLQQALRHRQHVGKPSPPAAAACAPPRRPASISPACSSAGTPPATPGTPGTSSSADEPAPRRRAPRTLTGKHVRQGQGASPETLRTLRRVLLERARLRSLGLLPPPKPKPKARRRK